MQRREETAEAKRAGRGVLWLAAAKLWFILASYAVQFSLPRLFDSAVVFGRFATTMNLVVVAVNVLAASTVQTLAKFLSTGRHGEAACWHLALKVQGGVGFCLAALLYAGAETVATLWLRDAALVPALRSAAAVIVVYALYASIVGVYNGRRAFQSQAKLDALLSLLRLLCLVGAAALGLGAAGAVASIALALALTLWVGLHGARPAAGGVAPHWRPWVLLALPLATFHLCLHGAMQFDLAVLKSRIAALAMAAGDAPGRAAAQAARFAAYYRAAQTFAFIPYQMVMSLAFVLFPTLARHLARGDARQTEQALCQTLRLAWLVLVPAATWVSANALQLMQVAYPAGYVAGAPALRWLVWGVAALALVVVQATALNAAGRAWWSTGVAALGLGAVLFGTRYAIDRTGPVPGALAAAGAATALAHVALFAISALSVWLLFRARLAWRTLLRVGLAAAVMAGITRLWPGPGLWALLRSLVAGGLGYVGLLVLFGEVGREDWQSLRTLLPQAKPPSGAG